MSGPTVTLDIFCTECGDFTHFGCYSHAAMPKLREVITLARNAGWQVGSQHNIWVCPDCIKYAHLPIGQRQAAKATDELAAMHKISEERKSDA